MIAGVRRAASAQAAFLAVAILINIIVAALTGLVTDPARHHRVAVAAVFDMTLTVSALYYWMVVRPGLRPWKSILMIAFLGLLRASFAHPDVVPGRERTFFSSQDMIIRQHDGTEPAATNDPIFGAQ